MISVYRSLWFRFLILFYLLMCALPLFAQVQLGVPLVRPQYFDANGHVLANGCIFTYISGTNTPLQTYTDFGGLTPNPNPVQLGADGRPPLGTDIWLTGGSAYRIKLVTQGGTHCATGFTIWTEDGITVGFASLLASNNTWTGTNTWQNTSTFNGTTIFNVGFTSNGPSNLTAGGSLAGTFTGTPTFSGTLNLPGGFVAGASTFTGPITSTVTTGTAPFIIASTTQVNNLNAGLLNGCTWAVPCPLGSTTPNTASITTLLANSFTLAGGTPQVATQGTDTHLLTAGTVTAGAGRTLCTDANGGATTAGCATGGFTQIATAVATPGCNTGGGSNSACNDVLTWSTPFADANYIPVCMGITPAAFIGQSTTNQNPVPTIASKTATTITVTTQTSRSLAAQYDQVFCIGVHP